MDNKQAATKPTSQKGSNVRNFISDIYKYVFEDQTEESSSRPLTEMEPRNSTDVRFSIGTSPLRTHQYSSNPHENTKQFTGSQNAVHQSLQSQHFNQYTHVQYPKQVMQHKREISQPQRMSSRYPDPEIEQLNQLSPSAHLQLSPRARQQLSPRSNSINNNIFTIPENQMSPRAQRGQLSPGGVLSPKRRIFEENEDAAGPLSDKTVHHQQSNSIFTSQVAALSKVSNIKSSPPANQQQKLNQSTSSQGGKGEFRSPINKDQELTPQKQNPNFKITEETPMNAFNSGTKMLSPNGDVSMDFKKLAEFKVQKNEEKDTDKENSKPTAGSTISPKTQQNVPAKQAQGRGNKNQLSVSNSSKQVFSQSVSGDRVVKQESVKVNPVLMSSNEDPSYESNVFGDMNSNNTRNNITEKAEPEDVQVHIPEEKFPEVPRSNKEIKQEENFDRVATNSTLRSQRTFPTLTKMKKLVLSLPSIVAFCLFALTVASLGFLEIANYTGDNMAAMKYLQMNLDKNNYFQSLYSIKAGETCGNNAELLNLGQFFGSRRGFLCDGVLYDDAPVTAASCQQVGGAPWKNIYVWEGISVCGRRNSQTYLKEPGVSCGTGYKQCHKVHCVPTAEACPVNKLTFVKNSTSLYINGSYQENLDRTPLIGFRVEVDSPCFHNSRLPQRQATYPLDSKRDLYGCGEYGKDQSNFFSLDSASEVNTYNSNGLASEIAQLPKVSDVLKSLNFYAEYRVRLDLNADSMCFSTFPSKVFMGLRSSVDSIRMHLYGLACISLLGLCATILISFLKRISISKKVLVLLSLISGYGVWIMVYYLWLQDNEIFMKAHTYSSIDIGSCFSEAQPRAIGADFRKNFAASLWWSIVLVYAIACLGALTIISSLFLVTLHFVMQRRARKQAKLTN